jgi:hypothetical protein
VPQYLGLIAWLLSIHKQIDQYQIWGTLLWQNLYRLKENYMTLPIQALQEKGARNLSNNFPQSITRIE